MKFFKNVEGVKATKSEKLAEKKEREVVGEATGSLEEMDRKGIKAQENMINDNYNSAEAEELVGGQDHPKQFEDEQKRGGGFVDIEDVPAEQEMIKDKDGEMVTKLDADLQDALDKVFELPENSIDKDPYDMRVLITDLFEDIESSGLNAKDKEKAQDDLFRKVNVFLPVYKAALESGLEDDKENELVRSSFKRIIGDIVYMGDNKEVLSKKRVNVKDARPGQDRGQAIHYNERGRGFLNKEEANASNSMRQRKTGFIGRRFAKGVKAFNPFTNKKEDI